MQFDNLSGRQTGTWKILKFDHFEYYGEKQKSGTSYYLCECVKCHEQKLVARSNLTQSKLESHRGCTTDAIVKKCVICGKIFETNRKNQMTCGEECSYQNHLNLNRIAKTKYREKNKKPKPKIELEPGCKKTSVAYCKKCKYFNNLSRTCDYTFITKINRGCKVGQCDKFEKK